MHLESPTFPCGHDNVIKRKLFPQFWTFLGGIHRSPATSPHKYPVMRALMFLWCGIGIAVKQTIERPVFWDYIAFTWRHPIGARVFRENNVNTMHTHVLASTTNNVMTWEGFQHHWSFVMGIHHRTKRPVQKRFGVFLVVVLNTLFNKQPSCHLFKTPWRRDAAVIVPSVAALLTM